jgi:hypothetical protein
MRLPHLLLLSLLLAALPCLPLHAKAKTAAPKHTALVGVLQSSEEADTPPGLVVVAGWVAGKGWLQSENTQGLMHKGDALSIHTLASSGLGVATLRDNGALDSEAVESRSAAGLRFQVETRPAAGKEDAYRKALDHDDAGAGPSLLAVWHSRDSPAPRWVTGRQLPTGNAVYRKVISDWLKAKRVSEAVVKTVVVEQVLVADINSDKRDEVFLSFRTPNTPTTDWCPEPSKDRFSYLVMRYLPRGSREPKSVVLDETPYLVHRVIGLCDLDGAGWTEVISEHWGVDQWGVGLHHWTGSEFSWVSGCGLGA